MQRARNMSVLGELGMPGIEPWSIIACMVNGYLLNYHGAPPIRIIFSFCLPLLGKVQCSTPFLRAGTSPIKMSGKLEFTSLKSLAHA